MPYTRVLLVRHGATVLSSEDRFAGAVDVLLSDGGRNQARLLGQRLRDQPLAAAYASPMSRTLETARLIVSPGDLAVVDSGDPARAAPGDLAGAAPRNLAVTPVESLREIAHGRWEGKTRAEVEREFPEEYSRYDHDPFSFAPSGGETGLQVIARSLPTLLELVQKHQGEQILIVSHKATIRLLLSSLLGFDSRKYRDRLDQSPAALNILDFRDVDHARLTLFNDTSHYLSIPEVPKARLSKVWDVKLS
jgi:broad specificity phosphatase PhoE